MTRLLISIVAVLGVAAQAQPLVPEGAQAISLKGEPLRSPSPSPSSLENLADAEKAYRLDGGTAESTIWLARRTAYTGDYRRAIEIFTEGIEEYPGDARMYRHRGHRYITIREIDRAIADLELAAKLIQGQENEIEPDGLPNAQNIPISSLHGNIWYHLGLAYYLKHDWENALRAYQAGYDAGNNDDNRVSTSHWIYMILSRMGQDKEAAEALATISPDMEIIENFVYHQLCLFYKGELTLDRLEGGDDSPAGAAQAYGIAHWYQYNGDELEASRRYEALLETEQWPAFGFIAAEAELADR